MRRLFYIVALVVAAPIIAAMMFGEFCSRILYHWALDDEVVSVRRKHPACPDIAV